MTDRTLTSRWSVNLGGSASSRISPSARASVLVGGGSRSTCGLSGLASNLFGECLSQEVRRQLLFLLIVLKLVSGA